MRPDSLESALAWLATQRGTLDLASDGCVVTISVRTLYGFDDGEKDIPAAIVSAVREVWDQINGKGNYG